MTDNSKTIKFYKKRLEHYEKRLFQHPNSTMYQGLVKTTQELILKLENGNNKTFEKV